MNPAPVQNAEWGLAPYPTPTAYRIIQATIALIGRLYPVGIQISDRRNTSAIPMYSPADSLPMFAVVIAEAEDFEQVTADLMLTTYPLWICYLISDAAVPDIRISNLDVQTKRQNIRENVVLPLQGLDELNDVTYGAKTPFECVAGDGATIASVMTFRVECREPPRPP